MHPRTIGLGNWIADDHAGHIHRAVRKAAAPVALAALRSGLWAQIESATLPDGPGFARISATPFACSGVPPARLGTRSCGVQG